MDAGDDRFEWEVVQDHYGEGRRERGRIVLRNLRHPARRSTTYRREMRRTGLMMAGLIGIGILGLGLILTLV